MEADSAMESRIVTDKTLGAPFYANPVRGAAHMMRASDGYYYAYDGEVANWTIHRSANGVQWQSLGSKAYPEGTWGKKNFWVPEVIEDNGKFYMFYCARIDASAPTSRIGLAISDRPDGPFRDIGHPLFDGTEMENWHVIDPNPFIDPDTGKKYLYFVKDGAIYAYFNIDLNKTIRESRIFGVELSADLMSVVGEPVELLRPSQPWEYKSHLEDRKDQLWIEAPEMLKKDGTFYLMYSANLYTTANYAIGYASSKNPLGPFVKYDKNPVVGSVGAIRKAGHNSIIRSPDGTEYFTSFTTLNDGRYMGRIGFRADDTLYVNGPIKRNLVMPSGTHDYANVAARAKVTASSTERSYRPEAVIDGEIGIYERFEAYEWRSDGEKSGAWIELQWDDSHQAEYILLYDSAVPSRKIREGRLLLNGPSGETIAGIRFPDGPGEPAMLSFPGGKPLKSVRFVADRLADPDGEAGMSEIIVLGKSGHN